MTGRMHDFNLRFCENCKQNRDADHLCNMRPLKDALSSAGDKVLYVSYDFQITQNKRYSGKATLKYLISSACKNFVRGARTWKTETACDAASECTPSGSILSGTC